MSDLLAIGASGLRSYRAALDAVGDNVANAQTDGYSRRTVRIAEVRVDAAASLTYRSGIRSDGSEPAEIVRAADAFRTQEARITAADAAREAARSQWLGTAETALGGRIAPALATAFANGDRLAADPTGAQPRIAFLDGLGAVASEIATSAGDLTRVADGIGDAASAGIDAANADLSALGAVNLMIRRQQSGTAAFAELEDQRDRLIDGLSQRLGATATIAADGTAIIKAGADLLLTLGIAASLSLAHASDGSLAFATGAGPFSIDSGSLAGLARAADAVADRRTALDTLASDTVAAFNRRQASGTTPDGRAGPPLLVLTAGAASIALATQSPDDIASATATATNGNMLALSAVRAAAGLEASAALIVAQHAAATAAARDTATMTGNRRDTAAAARDAVEGVDLDREAADLMRLQQSYQGAARVIQTARQIVDDILALFR